MLKRFTGVLVPLNNHYVFKKCLANSPGGLGLKGNAAAFVFPARLCNIPWVHNVFMSVMICAII